jgi:hypothetical protein
VELTVALALSAVVIVVGCALFVELARDGAAQAGREPAVGGATDVALEMLVRDVRSAVAREPAHGAWRGAGLVLRQADGDLVGWEATGERLVRRSGAADREPEARVVLDGLVVASIDADARGVVRVQVRSPGGPLRDRLVIARNFRAAGGGR